MSNQSMGQSSILPGNRRMLVILGLAAGVVLLVIAAVYFITPASSLPHFFPGYSAALGAHVHYKHGIAALLLSLAAFALAWFSSGPASAQKK